MNDSFLENVSDDFTFILWTLARLIIFTFMLERALYAIFDYSLWRDRIEGKGIRAPFTVVVAAAICHYFQFDVVYPVLDPNAGPTLFGIIITALIVAGGSQGAILLFQNILNFSREARESIEEIKKAQREADLEKAKAEKAEAEEAVARVRVNLAQYRNNDFL